jgi:hypothetical protein
MHVLKMGRWAIAVVATSISLFLGSMAASAQDKKPDGKNDKGGRGEAADRRILPEPINGTIVDVKGRAVLVKGADEKEYTVITKDAEYFNYAATAKARGLKQGMAIRFRGSINAEFKLVGTPTGLEVFTIVPPKPPADPKAPTEDEINNFRMNSVNVYPDGPAGGLGGDGNGGAGLAGNGNQGAQACLVVGYVSGVSKKAIFVEAGPVTIEVPADETTTIPVNLLDLSMAEVGDQVNASGFYLPGAETEIYAESINVTAAKMLGEEDEKKSKRKGKRDRDKKDKKDRQAADSKKQSAETAEIDEP